MPSFVQPYSAALAGEQSGGTPRPSPRALLLRLGRPLLALYDARRDRDIARVIERHGGLTDEAEREISRRFGAPVG